MENENQSVKQPYISLTSDFGFKRLMGTERDKGPLLDLLNTVLKGERHIVNLQLHNTARTGRIKDSRTPVLDLLCTDVTGSRFIVEMQKAKHPFFKDRCLFYSAGAIIDQEVKGKWDYKLLPVYTICFQDFPLDAESEAEYHRPVGLTYLNTGALFSDRLKFFFLELHRFGWLKEVPKDRLGQWCYLLKKMESLTEIPAALKEDPIFQEVFRRAEIANLTHQEMAWYSERQREINDAYSLQLGYKEEGLAEGRAEGEQKAKREIAQAMKKENCSLQLIATTTGLPVSTIEAL